MLSWYTHERATAQEMLKHPWLDTSKDDFDASYHYTDREYEVLMLKKQMKGSKEQQEQAEMSELKISEPEENAADVDEDWEDSDSDDSFLDSRE